MTAADRAVSWVIAVLVAVFALVLVPVDLALGVVDLLRRSRSACRSHAAGGEVPRTKTT